MKEPNGEGLFSAGIKNTCNIIDKHGEELCKRPTEPADRDSPLIARVIRITRRVFVRRFAPRGRDPAVADENLYRYCDNEPTEATDPSGTMLQYIDVSEDRQDGDAFTQFDYQDRFKASKKAAEDTADAVRDKVDDKLFDEIKAEHGVKFAGKEFTGTRQEFIDQVRREAESAGYTQNNGGLKELEAKLTSLVALNKKDYDVTAGHVGARSWEVAMRNAFTIARCAAFGLATLAISVACNSEAPSAVVAPPAIGASLSFARGAEDDIIITCNVVNVGALAIAVGVDGSLDWEAYNADGAWFAAGGAEPEKPGRFGEYVLLPPTRDGGAVRSYDAKSRATLRLATRDIPRLGESSELRVRLHLTVLVADRRSGDFVVRQVKLVGAIKGSTLWDKSGRLDLTATEGNPAGESSPRAVRPQNRRRKPPCRCRSSTFHRLPPRQAHLFESVVAFVGDGCGIVDDEEYRRRIEICRTCDRRTGRRSTGARAAMPPTSAKICGSACAPRSLRTHAPS